MNELSDWMKGEEGGGEFVLFSVLLCFALFFFFYPFGHEDKLYHAIKCLYTVSVKGKETSLCER